MSKSPSRVGKLREDAYFNELDRQLLEDLHELMVEAGEAVAVHGEIKSSESKPAEPQTNRSQQPTLS